jgi:hypothetical protein
LVDVVRLFIVWHGQCGIDYFTGGKTCEFVAVVILRACKDAEYLLVP